MLDKLRGSVRPSLTWLGFGVISIVILFWVLSGTAKDWKDYVLAYFVLVSGMINFWFGERNANKKLPTITTTPTQPTSTPSVP